MQRIVGSQNEGFEAMTLKDIADSLNVSVSTVSRALGKDTSGRGSTGLRATIGLAARQANYFAHPAALLLRKPQVILITVLLPRETGAFASEYYGSILTGVVSASREWETETRVALIDSNDEDIVEQIRNVSTGAGGVLCMARPMTLRQLVKLEGFERPCVVLAECL